jgi:hypothetical protein
VNFPIFIYIYICNISIKTNFFIKQNLFYKGNQQRFFNNGVLMRPKTLSVNLITP